MHDPSKRLLMKEKEMERTKHIALGVTGSIAAYKACELVRLFIKGGWGVHVVMTAAATRFVTPLTFRTLSQNSVYTGIFDETIDWHPEHIALADRCDVLVIAPCTANVIAKLANGIADDALTSLALAYTKPLVIAPAMNVNMFNHAATQSNLSVLRERGAVVIEPGEGDLACGTTAKGRLAEPQLIFDEVCRIVDTERNGRC